MRVCKTKSNLKKLLELQIDVSNGPSANDIKCFIIDASAILYIVHWPSDGIVSDLISNISRYVASKLKDGDVYFVFDRYRDFSIKSVTRSGRGTHASRVHQLTTQTTLPTQKVIMTVNKNKQQLIDLICTNLINDSEFKKKTSKNKLIVTGSAQIPVELSNGNVTQRHDLKTSHEEADNIMIHQMLHEARSTGRGIKIVSDDTDVFILLIYHYNNAKLSPPLIMQSPVKGRAAVDIRATVIEHKEICHMLLGMHALSGCDTVASCYGIGKTTALKILRDKQSLEMLGDID